MLACTHKEHGKFELMEKLYDIFENKLDGVIKIAVTNE